MASRGVNRVSILGFVGGDPLSRTTDGGTQVTKITVATSESWVDKQSGEKQERTEWHRVKFFGRLAEIAGEYLKKGRQVYVEGSLRTDKYTDKQGVERYTTDIIANEMQMIGGAADHGAAHGNSDSGGGQSPRTHSQEQRASQATPAPARTQSAPRSNGSARQRNDGPRQPDNGYSGGGGGGFGSDDVPF